MKLYSYGMEPDMFLSPLPCTPLNKFGELKNNKKRNFAQMTHIKMHIVHDLYMHIATIQHLKYTGQESKQGFSPCTAKYHYPPCCVASDTVVQSQ